ncbi:hypothetical protein EVAR_82054_1 [Eumeta japonica]|uniref:Uncharacterized protein n=1 Tax=Eumeta variegata TaxID=151549 RepID=A0A4C1U1J7_EUMVA|nr:hypothetical protein EVAR_82054_1 [Eumeta japonica]
MNTRNPKSRQCIIGLLEEDRIGGNRVDRKREEGVGHRDSYSLDKIQQRKLRLHLTNSSRVGCVRPLSLFYSDASADGVEERSLVPRSRSRARLRRNATMSHAFSCVQPAFIDL